MVAAGVELYRATNDENPIYKPGQKIDHSPYSIMGYAYIGPLAALRSGARVWEGLLL